ncbi:hypothetical protein [Salimicrobium flavidum]|uniref:Uncharacterized membrane protein YeaQ/YmgE, transglycosylase-associated protein family n=1 Tax=Salimicrobium flavidum TaxID=570947 RepID=A0A1N7JN90_9BACI|nr:hypothetical protein [Salimicrobium flavidum]SIS50706.1 Uncharacterized membrane protein YeaQ/YmgE, transglycosylase-associated protein family [Salimicrobium flavidum]
MGSLIGLITGIVIVTILLFMLDMGISMKNKITLLISAAVVAGLTLLAFITFPPVFAIVTGAVVLAAVYVLMKSRVVETNEAETLPQKFRNESDKKTVEEPEDREEEASEIEADEPEELPAEDTYVLHDNPELSLSDTGQVSDSEDLPVPNEKVQDSPSVNLRTPKPLDELDVEEELLAARSNQKQKNMTEEKESSNREKPDSRNIEEAFELEDIKPAEEREVDR